MSGEFSGDIDVEAALLGAILIQNDAHAAVSRFLEPEHFTEPLHREIYRIASDMIAKGRECNPVLIKPYLPGDARVGDMTVNQYLAALAAGTITVINARDYGLAIYEYWLRRQANAIGQSLIDRVQSLDPGADILDHLAEIEEELTQLRLKRFVPDGIQHGVDEWLEQLSAAYQRQGVSGVPIVFPEIREVLSEPCFEAGNLYGLLSSSGEGKTSLVMQVMWHALTHGHPVLFLSYDQSAPQCYRQMAAQQVGITGARQRQGLINEREFEGLVSGFASQLRKLPFEIKKCSTEKVGRLVAYARQFVRRRGGDKEPLVVIDHIKAITPEDSRTHEGAQAQQMTRPLKAAAEDLNGAVLLINQRNGYGMRRDNPRPIPLDLFGGEQARHDYDAIVYLYRFKKWLEERKSIASSDGDWKRINRVFPEFVRDGTLDVAEVGAVKSRFGDPNKRERLLFDAPLTRYTSFEPPKPQEELPI